MPACPPSLRCKYAALAATPVFVLGLLSLGGASWLASQRVEHEAGERLLAQAKRLAERSPAQPTPAQLEQLRDELVNGNQTGELFVSTNSGTVLLGTAVSPGVPPASPFGWRIQRWPDGKVYLTGTASVTGSDLTVRSRLLLDIALAEVERLQWQIFHVTWPLLLLAALLGAWSAPRWRKA